MAHYKRMVMYFEDLVAILRVGVALRGEWIALFVIQVLFQVEESVEEDGRHLATFQVVQRHFAGHGRVNHVQHLNDPNSLKSN